jgi:Protein of unknown function (DUF4232)
MKITTRLRYRYLAGAAAVVAAGAIVLPAVAQASPARPEAVRQCSAAETYVWLALAPNGAAGTIYYPVEFTNMGSRACWLYGYPGVSGLTSRGRRVGPAAGRFTSTPRRVTIGASQTVHALLGIVEDGVIAGCRAVTAAGLGVYPPGQRSQQQIGDFSFPACSNKVYMHVYPVQPGIGVP